MRRAGPLLSPALLRQFLEPWGDVRHHILRGLMEKNYHPGLEKHEMSKG